MMLMIFFVIAYYKLFVLGPLESQNNVGNYDFHAKFSDLKTIS